MPKIQRNALCWCKSGKKYKKCHGHPSYTTQTPLSQIIQDQKDQYTQNICYTPTEYHHECSGHIIQAHTISKSKNLTYISNNGHVYSFMGFNLGHLIKSDGEIQVRKISIKQASTFSGFCSKHDSEIFKPLDEGFDLTLEKIFLNYYRTMVRELYLKEKNASYQKTTMKNYDKGLSTIEQILYQISLSGFSTGTETGHRDLKIIKSNMDKNLLSKNFSSMKYYAIIINKIPDIISTCVWVASSDFEGNSLVDLFDVDQYYNSICVSTLVLSNEQGLILFSWDDELKSPECYKFIHSLHQLSSNEKIQACVYWLFAYNENIYFSSQWWDSLKTIEQQQITDIFNSTFMKSPDLSQYNSLNVVDWNIDEIKTNIF